jgi:hypothetical protein
MLFRSATSTKLRNAAAKTQATAQSLLAAAKAAQARAMEQRKLAVAAEAKERVAELQLRASALKASYIQAGNAYAKAIAERNVLEATLASCKIKVEETCEVLDKATVDFAAANQAVKAAQAELSE